MERLAHDTGSIKIIDQTQNEKKKKNGERQLTSLAAELVKKVSKFFHVRGL